MSTPGAPRPLDDSGGFHNTLGIELIEAGPTRMLARLRIEPHHLQPYGIVHGGVYCAVAETLASMGAALNGMQHDPGNGAAGLENHTTFLRAARLGTEVEFEATPVHAGRRTQAWEVCARDAAGGRDLARSQVRLMIVRPDTL